MDFVGCFANGIETGLCWKYCEGGGYLVGTVHAQTGQFTGPEIAFLYPDLCTAFLGQFEDGKMISGKATTVIGTNLDSQTQILSPIFAEPSAASLCVSFCKSTKTSLGDNLLVPDPYEARMIEIRDSEVPDSGQGVFARQDLAKGTIVAFYNGVRLQYKLGGPKEEWASSGYKIYINADYISGERMDIPEEYVSLDHYKASLGHKLNHSFRANCEEWFFEHPRFGLIPCERTTRDVLAGEELFLDYEYDPYNCPPWFQEQLIAFKASMTEEEERTLLEKYARFNPDYI